MNKSQYAALGRLFMRDLSSAFDNLPNIVQSKAKAFRDLHRMGYATYETFRLGGRLPVNISGYSITLAGHAAYCTDQRTLAAVQPEPTTQTEIQSQEEKS